MLNTHSWSLNAKYSQKVFIQGGTIQLPKLRHAQNSSHEAYMQIYSNELQHEENNAYKSFLLKPKHFHEHASHKKIMET